MNRSTVIFISVLVLAVAISVIVGGWSWDSPAGG